MSSTLRDEIKQTRPFTSLAQEAQLNIVRTAALLDDEMDQVLRPFGISVTQYNVLRILRGSEPDGLCRNNLRGRMITRMPDVTRLLDRMEEAGLVTRSRDSDDRRMVRSKITAEGLRILGELDSRVEQEHQRQFAVLDAEQLQTLIALLTTVRQQR